MKKIFTSILVLTFVISGYSQEVTQPTSPKLKHHVGLHAGATTGLGLSYRYWPKRLGFQFTTAPAFGQNFSFVSLGLSGLYTFKDNENIDFYGYLGNHLILIDGNAQHNIGLGAGFKFEFVKVLNLNVQAGYGVYNTTSDIYSSLTGEVGLYYNF